MVPSRERNVKLPGDISLKRIAAGAAAGVGVALAAALALAALVSGGKIGPGPSGLWAALAVFVGGLAAGVISGGKRRILASSLLAALAMFALLAILGLAAYGGLFSLKMSAILLIILPVSCIIGSVISSIVK